MKKVIHSLSLLTCFCISAFLSQFARSDTPTMINHRPDDFISVKQIIPTIQVDMRYYTSNNFVGRRIKGYQAPVCLITKQTATALKKVQESLLPMGLSLKVYDCYRPQQAVNDFVQWSKNIRDIKTKAQYYPRVDKSVLFKAGYIDAYSGHSRGSTIDVTIVPHNTSIPAISEGTIPRTPCTAPKALRSADNSLDFGTGFDCFSPVSHPNYAKLSAQVKANRLLLRHLMINAGFKPLKTEWWHFTLKNEPYPNHYFNFPVT